VWGRGGRIKIVLRAEGNKKRAAEKTATEKRPKGKSETLKSSYGEKKIEEARECQRARLLRKARKKWKLKGCVVRWKRRGYWLHNTLFPQVITGTEGRRWSMPAVTVTGSSWQKDPVNGGGETKANNI